MSDKSDDLVSLSTFLYHLVLKWEILKGRTGIVKSEQRREHDKQNETKDEQTS